MDQLWQDVRFAVRSLSRARALSLVAVLTFALGIGANTAVFSLVNAVLIRPLPFADPDKLVMLSEQRADGDEHNVSGHEFVAWRAGTTSFDGMAMYSYSGFTLTGAGDPTTVSAQTVTAGFFDVLRLRPMLGRTFRAGEDAPGAPRLAIIGRSLWQKQFGMDSTVVGKRIVLDEVAYEIVGVMDSRGDMSSDVWVPMNVADEARKVGKHSNFVIARLRRGATTNSALADVSLVAERLSRDNPGANAGHGVRVTSLYTAIVGDVRRPMLVALGAALFVLLIACANVGHLLLTRAAARQRELAIRTALGAGRRRLVRQLVTESLLLSMVGGVLGLVFAAWIADALPALSAVHVPRLAEVNIDWRVLAMTAGLGVASGIACGVIPALRASSPTLRTWLADGARTANAPGQRVAGLFVVSEVAIALMLLIGAGLSIKSFVKLTRVDPGFQPTNVLAVNLPLPGARYPRAEEQRRALNTLVDDIAAVPGVVAAGSTTSLPLGPCCTGMAITLEGKPNAAPGNELKANMAIVGGRYFDAMRIPVRAGRAFASTDARLAVPLIRWFPQQPVPPHFAEPQATPVAVVSETMARRFWPNEPAVGKRFRVLFSPWITVIGVVADVRQSALLEEPTPLMYLSNLQEPSGAVSIVVRTRDPLAVSGLIRQRIRAFDSKLPIGAIEPMDRVLWNSIGRPRFNALLLGASAAIALSLALIGVYGVMSYSVARRTREIGIRRALGAQRGDVLRLVLGRAALLVLTGLAIGVLGAFAVTRVLTTLLYGVTPTDPATFAIVATSLGAVAFVASYLPGRRATLVDPTDALRAE